MHALTRTKMRQGSRVTIHDMIGKYTGVNRAENNPHVSPRAVSVSFASFLYFFFFLFLPQWLPFLLYDSYDIFNTPSIAYVTYDQNVDLS